MKGKEDNIGSCVEKRSHLALTPEPMYVRNDIGHKMYKEMGESCKTKRPGSTVYVDDMSNKSGMRAQGGY